MLRALILFLLLPAMASADPRPPTGLLAKDSPLPATIPLQVRAPEGQDYAVILSRDDAPVISGYLRGGEVLRLLVPPGEMSLAIAAGSPEDWQGGNDLFGDRTMRTLLPRPLIFRITGDSRREGHAITLALRDGALRVTDRRDRTICQIADWDIRRVTEITPLGTQLRWLDPHLQTRSRVCD